ncbi:MAG TPA: DUF4145 domain-containing protein [Actinophytocola sp.]|nr:DUF4145 domain-containing protein [Actinophytocola sp.]HEV2780786.1 DUF4145 domain-containing protein [Actinophytocola sp.]
MLGAGSADSPEPPAEDDLPALDKEAFVCPRCGVYAHQHWQILGVGEGEVVEVPGRHSYRSMWKEARCSRCSKPSVWRRDQMIYPLARLGAQPHADMPDEVRRLYDEASTVAAVSRRAGAALARAMVERLIKVLDPRAPKGAKLDTRIDRIRGRVSTPLGEMLEVVRYLGNKMLHVEEPDKLG